MEIQFISGGTGLTEIDNIYINKFKRIYEIMNILDNVIDYIIIDTGAGISKNVTNFVFAVREIILVTNPEPTSITDAYAMLKLAKRNNQNCNIKLVANKVKNIEEAGEIFQKMSFAARKFLNIEMHELGYVFDDEHVYKAAKLQEPFILRYPRCSAARNIEDIAYKLDNNNKSEASNIGVKSFLQRLYSMLNVSNNSIRR